MVRYPTLPKAPPELWSAPLLYRLSAAYRGYLTINTINYTGAVLYSFATTQQRYLMTKKKENTTNYKILHDAAKTLEALRDSVRLRDMDIEEIQVHLVDEDGDGIVFSLEYDELTGELNKTFHSMEEYYDGTSEHGENKEMEIEVELEESTALFDKEYYGGRKNFTVEVFDDDESQQNGIEDDFLKYELDKIKPLLN